MDSDQSTPLLAANFGAAHDYATLATPSHTTETPHRLGRVDQHLSRVINTTDTITTRSTNLTESDLKQHLARLVTLRESLEKRHNDIDDTVEIICGINTTPRKLAKVEFSVYVCSILIYAALIVRILYFPPENNGPPH